MSAARIALAASLLALASVLTAVVPASADLGPIHLVSRTVPEQATEAGAPAVSADGRYVAFQGTLDEGRKGVFRADLLSGEIARVAAGAPNEASSPGSDARAPSISADGRYVSFTTAAALDPADDAEPGSSDVYVADMAASPPTYELASAADGSAQAIAGGAAASPRVALSASGRKLAFVSGGQVYVRDLDTSTTTLVSVARDPLTAAMEPGVAVPGGAVFPALSGASLSADGTTVAWVGTHLPEQVPLLSDERAAIEAGEAPNAQPSGYDEPLWRRLADGPLAPTRRIVGGGDPLAPGCPGTAGTLAEPACRGPFPSLTGKNANLNGANGWLGVFGGGSSQGIDGLPQLSADGRTVAVIGNPTEASNVFLVDMRDGLSRKAAVRQLTAQVPVRPEDEASAVVQDAYLPLNAFIWDVAISADGERIAFVTARQQFPLAPPNLVGQPPSQLGLVELYLVNREVEALLRVTHGLGGVSEPSLAASGLAKTGAGASAPSLSGDGEEIAFASTASNLVAGDGNENSDVFAVRDDSASRAPVTSISPPLRQRKPKRGRRLVLSAFSLPSGRVKLTAVASSRGLLRAEAAAPPALGSRPRRLGVDFARARVNRPVSMVLALPHRLRHLARSPEGVYATARVVFRPAKGKAVERELEVRFHAHPSKQGGKR